jgi:sugar phosphate isomerase/epimerase
MKIGVSSYSFSRILSDGKHTYEDICDIAKSLGYDGIEFIGLENRGWGITGDEIEMAKNIRAHCERIGLEIVAYTVGANFLAEDMKAELARIKHCVDVCHALGAPIMRHDVASKLRASHLYSYRDAIEEMVPYIREVTEYAERLGIRTCTENHGFIFQYPERVEELILAVDRENYGWLCDMGNFLCTDCDPVESVRIAAPHAFHVHAKDFLYKSGDTKMPAGYQIVTAGGSYLRGTVVGHGDVPVVQCINILKRAGYDGYVSLEFEGPEENLYALKCGLEYLREVIG